MSCSGCTRAFCLYRGPYLQLQRLPASSCPPACLPGSPYKRHDLLPTFVAVNLSAEDKAINTLIPGVGETALGWSPSPGVDPSPAVAAEPTAPPRRALR